MLDGGWVQIATIAASVVATILGTILAIQQNKSKSKNDLTTTVNAMVKDIIDQMQEELDRSQKDNDRLRTRLREANDELDSSLVQQRGAHAHIGRLERELRKAGVEPPPFV